MNKRFRELLKKATTTHYSGPGEISEVDQEKFAELMFKDVLDIVGEHIDENSKEERFIALRALRHDLKQHFGIDQ